MFFSGVSYLFTAADVCISISCYQDCLAIVRLSDASLINFHFEACGSDILAYRAAIVECDQAFKNPKTENLCS